MPEMAIRTMGVCTIVLLRGSDELDSTGLGVVRDRACTGVAVCVQDGGQGAAFEPASSTSGITYAPASRARFSSSTAIASTSISSLTTPSARPSRMSSTRKPSGNSTRPSQVPSAPMIS